MIINFGSLPYFIPFFINFTYVHIRFVTVNVVHCSFRQKALRLIGLHTAVCIINLVELYARHPMTGSLVMFTLVHFVHLNVPGNSLAHNSSEPFLIMLSTVLSPTCLIRAFHIDTFLDSVLYDFQRAKMFLTCLNIIFGRNAYKLSLSLSVIFLQDLLFYGLSLGYRPS